MATDHYIVLAVFVQAGRTTIHREAFNTSEAAKACRTFLERIGCKQSAIIFDPPPVWSLVCESGVP